MKCSNCGTENTDDSRFCEQCGTKLEIIIKCPKCGKENPDGAKFCLGCGNKLEDQISGEDSKNSKDKDDVKSEVSEDKNQNKIKESTSNVSKSVKNKKTDDKNNSKSKSSSSKKLEDNEEFCSNCGEKVPKDSARCIFCGEWLQKPANKLVDEKFIIYSVVLSFILMLTSVYAMYIISTVVQGFNIFAFSILMLLAAIIGVYFVNEHIYVSIGSLIVFLILDMIFMYMMGFLGPITYKTGFLFLLFFLIALSINYAQENEKNGLIAMMILSIVSLIFAISTKDYVEIIILLILIIYGFMTMRNENIF